MFSNNCKKQIINCITCFVFPRALRRQAKRHLKYWFGLEMMKPESFWDRYQYKKQQQDFIKKHANDDIFSYRLISLGADCFSRTIPTLWGIKPRKKQGELGYPFDLSRHNLTSVVNAIKNDFDGYFDYLYFDKKLDVWLSDNDNIVYCHEPDCHENDKELIIERFSERIDNLRKILNEDDKKAVFICRYAPELSPSDINVIYNLYNELYTSLQKYRKDRVFELLIVDTFGHLNKERLDPNINLLTCPWFDYDYVWHYDECRYSKLGLKFELTFINHLLKLVK